MRGYWKYLVGVFAIVLAVDRLKGYVNFDKTALSPAAVGLVVTALSIFLAFRVSEAYSRWWEARTLWGGIVNDSRNFARQITTLVSEPSTHTQLVHRHLAWTNALRHALRCEEDTESLRPLIAEAELAGLADARNRTTQLMQRQGEQIAALQARGAIEPIGRLALEATLSQLTQHQGACEKIKTTGFPDRVAYFSRITAWIIALALPFVVLDSHNEIDWIDIIVIPFLMLSFLLTERLGSDLKKPFENRVNDTPMTALCRTIEIDLRQQLGETQIPEPLEPVDGVLM